jgi:hypothetical protein
MSIEIIKPADYEREVVLAHLERERELWLPHYRTAKRAEGFNADAKARAAYFMRHIDGLLSELIEIDAANVEGRGTE